MEVDTKNSQSPDCQVLIVGAGPTGLTLAAILSQAGVKVRIIDKNQTRSIQSKALGVQAGTLEALSDVFGSALAEQMIGCGQPARTAELHFGNRNPVRVELSSIPSLYNFILILEQSETERILEKTLDQYNVEVEREMELRAYTQDGSKIISEVEHNGVTEKIYSQYLIGCDGAHSIVRHLAGIPFVGAAYTGDFVLGDVTVDWPWEYGVVRTFVSSSGVLAGFPLNSGHKYRLILISNEKNQTGDSTISLEEFSKLANDLCPKSIRISDPIWLTRFRVHHRIVSSYRKGNVFLAGDAAHIHSPAGGQGMNIGIQDSINLGHKLIQVLSRGAPAELLDRYEKERLPIARKVLRSTDFAFRMALLPNMPFLNGIRNLLFPLVVRNRFLQKKVARAISEVLVAREEIRMRGKLEHE